MKAPVFAALYNDAGVGIDRAGLGRLAVLDVRVIAAATVSADSVEIGDALSTFRDGIIVAVNRVTARLGGAESQPARELFARLVEAHRKELAG